MRLANCLTNKNLPKISLWQSYKGIAVPVGAKAVSIGCRPVIASSNKCSETVQTHFTSCFVMPPLPYESVISPFGAIPWKIRYILTKERHDSGWVFVWPLKYWTTDSPELLAAVVTWNVRLCCLLQWNLIWVKDKCLLSSFMALIVITILWFMNLLIPRYDGSAVQAGGVVELSTIKMDVRSQPPSNVK